MAEHTPSSIWPLSSIRDDIAEVLEHSNPNRPDYATDVELEQLEQWQAGIAAAEARESSLVAACKKVLSWYTYEYGGDSLPFANAIRSVVSSDIPDSDEPDGDRRVEAVRCENCGAGLTATRDCPECREKKERTG